MKKALLTVILTMSALSGPLVWHQSPARGQETVRIEGADLIRAKNQARQTIEALNGGIQQYRAEPAMHGPICRAPFVIDDSGDMTFTFRGGAPGASPFTVENVVEVTQAGEVEVRYNGPIRPNSPEESPAAATLAGNDPRLSGCNTQTTLIRAKNLARKAAESANGGLSQYRAEPAMHGPVAEAPFVENADGSYTFIFQGGAPGSEVYTVESVVTVTPDGQFTVDYNGAVRP